MLISPQKVDDIVPKECKLQQFRWLTVKLFKESHVTINNRKFLLNICAQS